MKQGGPRHNSPLCSGLDQPWPAVTSRTAPLRLNTLDFSDLWDEEDPELGSSEDDGGVQGADIHQKDEEIHCSTPVPPLPPIAPPLPPAVPLSTPGRAKGQTLRLHWRELQDLPLLPRVTRFGAKTIWAGLEPVHLDTNRLEYLFESRTNTTISTILEGRQKQPCISLLGVKRSNIVTIALRSLPPPHLLPPAIISMDCCVLDREDLQKLQALVPSEEELVMIREAQSQSPHSPLGPAENCLLTLGSIPHLSQRMQLWAFTLDYDSLEREIAEPLYNLKLAMEQLATNQTFRYILATVLAIGNFLNGCKARGFELSYLSKLSQVKDTHSRQPLLHHVCVLMLQLYPQATDLYSDIAAVTCVSKCDYTQVQASLSQLESRCKTSWEQLHLLQQGGRKGPCAGVAESTLRQQIPSFLKECEERLAILRAVHRRVSNRFHSFLLFLGYPYVTVKETSPETFCKTVSDFALEYRTTHQVILQQREREKEKQGQRGCSTSCQIPSQESLEHNRLQEVLKTPEAASRVDYALPRHRSKKANTSGGFV